MSNNESQVLQSTLNYCPLCNYVNFFLFEICQFTSRILVELYKPIEAAILMADKYLVMTDWLIIFTKHWNEGIRWCYNSLLLLFYTLYHYPSMAVPC